MFDSALPQMADTKQKHTNMSVLVFETTQTRYSLPPLSHHKHWTVMATSYLATILCQALRKYYIEERERETISSLTLDLTFL